MARRTPGLALSEELERVLELAQVTERTLYNWRTGRVRVPGAARVLARIVMYGELPHAGEAWDGWRFERGVLVAPEGFTFEPHEIRNVHYLRAAAEAALEQRTAPAQFQLPGF